MTCILRSMTVILYQRAYKKFHPNFPYFVTHMDEICYRKPLHNTNNKNEFHENQCSASLFSLMAINEIFYCIFYIIHPIWLKFGTRVFHNNLEIVCFVNISTVTVVRVSGYRYRGPGFDSRRYQIF